MKPVYHFCQRDRFLDSVSAGFSSGVFVVVNLATWTRNAFMYFGPRIFKNLGFDANLFQTRLGPGVCYYVTIQRWWWKGEVTCSDLMILMNWWKWLQASIFQDERDFVTCNKKWYCSLAWHGCPFFLWRYSSHVSSKKTIEFLERNQAMSNTGTIQLLFTNWEDYRRRYFDQCREIDL